MRRARVGPVVVLVAAVALLGASIAWVVSRDDRSGAASRSGAWMMGYAPGGVAAPVTSVAAARARVAAFAERLDLRVGQVLRFERNYYVKLVDARGAGAAEVLVDPQTGTVSLEYGPARMWNTRYGMAGGRLAGMPRASMMGRYGDQATGQAATGMMGRSGGQMMGGGPAIAPAASGPVSVSEARTLAQPWLDANDAGVRVESGGDAFPGYFAFETLRDGRIEGMISVRESTGAVWRHWWHGAFVSEA
jgi:hypothetical protein